MHFNTQIFNSDGAEHNYAVRLLSKLVTKNSKSILEHNCKSYLLFDAETSMGNGIQTFLYLLGLVYCFIGLSTITGCFFLSMEKVVEQTRKVVTLDPATRAKVVKREKIWNYTLADISLLAVGTSFPHISLATIDAFQKLGQLYAGGLGPATLVGSAAFNMYPIHAVCVVVPKRGTVKKISDLGVWLVELVWSFWAYIWLYIIVQVWTPNVVTIWEAGLTLLQFGLLLLHAYAQDRGWHYFSLQMPREDKPDDWMPVKTSVQGGSHEDSSVVDFISKQVPDRENMETFSLNGNCNVPSGTKGVNISLVFLQQLKDALTMEDYETKKNSGAPLRSFKILWQLINLPWRISFAFIPPADIADGWVAFIVSLCCMTGISYVLIELTNLISCVTGLNPYVIVFTALASGTSWPDLIGSKIAAERKMTADSAIANITCRFSFLGNLISVTSLFVWHHLIFFPKFTIISTYTFERPLSYSVGVGGRK